MQSKLPGISRFSILTKVGVGMVLCLFHFNLSAQTSAKGQKFWIGFLENVSLLFNGEPEFGLVVSSEEDVTGLIRVPQTGLEIPFSLTAGETQEIFLPDAVWYTQGTEIIDNKGILVEASADITLQVYHYRIYFAESARILPETMLASEYHVLAAEDFNSNSPSSLVIVATEDNTTVEITPSTLTQGLHAPNLTFSVVLNEGQNYQIHAANDLSGTIVNALGNKKIAVFSGARQADIWCEGDDSHLWEQLPPKTMWRTKHVIVPYQGQGGDPIKIMASADGTEIKKNCEDWIVLNENEFFEVLIDEVSYIESNSPVLIAQLNKSQNCNESAVGGPSFSFVNPLTFQQYESKIIVPAAEGLPSSLEINRVTVICNAADVAEILLDGASLQGFDFFGPAWSFAQVQVELTPGLHHLQSTKPFWTHFHGLGQYDAYSHGGGFTEEVPIQWPISINVQGSPGQDELCIDDVIQFSVTTDLELVAWEWDFGNGTTSILENPNQFYTAAGDYWIQFSGSDASGCVFEQSLLVQIENCEDFIQDYNSGTPFFILHNHLYSEQFSVMKMVNSYDNTGRLLATESTVQLPMAIPPHAFLLQVVDEKNRAYSVKTARLKLD
jgi:hypothetical protein